MPRFFVDGRQSADGIIEITGEDSRHIARALRMAVGDAVTVCDSEGGVFECELIKIRDELCECRVLKECESKCEPLVDITLFMAFPKGDKLETVIQKAVELGVCSVVAFESSRCIKRPKAEKIDKQLQRYTKIAHEAAKQCGRARLSRIEEPVSFRQMIEKASSAEQVLFCYEGEGAVSLRETLEKMQLPKTVSVIVGSEGGFSPLEARECIEAGFTPVNLGPRILRCETAPSYVLSCLSYRFEL